MPVYTLRHPCLPHYSHCAPTCLFYLSFLLVSCVPFYFLALWPWTCYLTSLCFNSFICKSGDNNIQLKGLKRQWIGSIFIKIQKVPDFMIWLTIFWLYDCDLMMVTLLWWENDTHSIETIVWILKLDLLPG